MTNEISALVKRDRVGGGGTHLSPQHPGTGGRRTVGLRLAWATYGIQGQLRLYNDTEKKSKQTKKRNMRQIRSYLFPSLDKMRSGPSKTASHERDTRMTGTYIMDFLVSKIVRINLL